MKEKLIKTASQIQQELLSYLKDIYPESINGKELANELKHTQTTIRVAAEKLAEEGEVKLFNLSVGFALKALSGHDISPIELPAISQPNSQTEAEKATKKETPKARNKPFTPNPTKGYQVANGKVKIFLDRRASSHTLTLSVDDLRELVRAVEKAED